MGDFLLGAAAMAYWVAGLFFLRFWRQTQDRLFCLFAVAFWILGFNRLGLALVGQDRERYLAFGIVRLAAYLVIVLAILDKNRFWSKRDSSLPPDKRLSR